MNFDESFTEAVPTTGAKKVRAYRFEIFKGVFNADGKVEKICTMGHSTLFEGSTTYCVYLKTLLKDQFYLLPEQEMGRSFDYVILTREPSTIPGRKYFWNRVGVGKVLSDQNAGLMKLEFDLFGGVDMFLSFHDAAMKEMEARSNPAA
jgi:hypothetical protein